MTPELAQRLQPLQAAHTEIYEITRAYQSLFALQRISLALWHKGQTLTKQNKEEAEQQFEDADDEPPMNPNSMRMLCEVYRWHHALKEQNAPRDAFPVLALGHALQYSARPDMTVFIDSYDLTMRVGEMQTQLPEDSDGLGRDEMRLWRKYVLPKIRPTAVDIRLYDRKTTV